ncbi:MAG: phytanoyl-CoA dioxygenase family protein [Myxococcota bacterium]
MSATRHDAEMIPSPPRVVPTDDERSHAARLPLSTRFILGHTITGVQQSFLDLHGYILFSEVATHEEVARILEEVDTIQTRWLSERRDSINGIPIWVGEDERGAPFIQRFAFTSLYSDYIRTFVRDERFMPVRSLIGERTRVGDEEKDGVVFNRNMTLPGSSAYSKLGWHTDGLRDLFMVHPDAPRIRVPGPMLNVGMHFDYVRACDGGLRLIPGSHNQGFRSMLLKKPYFISNRPDPNEVAVETRPGDLTVHDGRMWHRVARCPHTGRRSLRRTMYVPYLVDTFQARTEGSGTPFYHRLNRRLGRLFRAG